MLPCDVCGFGHLPELSQCADKEAAVRAILAGKNPQIGSHRMSYPSGRLDA